MPDYEYESKASAMGYDNICGVDEAGRGPLAGPVYAAAVILPQGLVIDGLNDSKKLSEKKRELLYDKVIENAIAWSVGVATEQEIDEVNILQATYLAMRRAVEGLEVKADYALIDGNRMPPLSIEGETVIKGDALSMSIAAASIIAKVSRDRFMLEIDKEYPEYQFSKHKGYGTALHYEMIEKYGVSPVHRRSFLKKLL
ncbi:MAG: ribonuclease HII [Clostridia bacterium]|nr:ribonuclease HII [Clostridia bacterium]